MNVGRLKEIIKDLPDDTPVLVPGLDHSYVVADPINASSVMRSQGKYVPEWEEDWGEASTPETKYSKRVLALIIGM